MASASSSASISTPMVQPASAFASATAIRRVWLMLTLMPPVAIGWPAGPRRVGRFAPRIPARASRDAIRPPANSTSRAPRIPWQSGRSSGWSSARSAAGSATSAADRSTPTQRPKPVSRSKATG